jgi:hypothetical protein
MGEDPYDVRPGIEERDADAVVDCAVMTGFCHLDVASIGISAIHNEVRATPDRRLRGGGQADEQYGDGQQDFAHGVLVEWVFWLGKARQS